MNALSVSGLQFSYPDGTDALAGVVVELIERAS